MSNMIPRIKLKRTFNFFLVLKIAMAIALVYQVAPSILDHFFSSRNTGYVNEQPIYLKKEIVSEYYDKRKYWLTSNLGSVLFKNQPINKHQQDKTFVVLVWKYWGWLKARHLGGHTKDDPLDECSVKNCIFTGDNKKINSVDAVLVHIQHGIFPQVQERNTSQKWVFLSDESPYNAFSMANPKPTFSKLANVFNWSMTYRSDADVPVPYGRTVPLASTSVKSVNQSIPHWKKKQNKVLVTALISHCTVTKRMSYINELKKHIKVDIYGKCSTKRKKSCPGSFKADCPTINRYLFYLAFENSGCRQYLTEKIFYNAYAKGAIPIVMGPPVSDCEKLLPPHSFLHVDNYATPKDLAKEIKKISQNKKSLQMFHEWRRDFRIVNEHGYFQTKSYHLCRLCEALNYNDDKTKVYDEDNLKLYLEPKLLCSKL